MSNDRSISTMVAVLALAGCPGGGHGDDCLRDADCSGGDVCARDSVCTPGSQVKMSTVQWTVRGGDANTISCSSHPDLVVTFVGTTAADTLGFTPVPCDIGQFFIDKLPTRFREVELGIEGASSTTKAIGGTGVTVFDLP